MTTIEQAAQLMTRLTYLSRDEPIFVEIGTVAHVDNNGNKHIYSAVSIGNVAGYIPGVSTVIGALRILINISKLIYNIVKLVFLQQGPHQTYNKICRNVVQIARGAIEIVPFAGNLVIFAIDRIRILMIERKINDEIKNQTGIRNFYANGQSICRGGDKNSIDDDISFMVQAGARFAR